MWVGVALFLFLFCKVSHSEDFPSLLTTNATMAIVIDREYLAEDYERIKTGIEEYLVYAKREILKHGGVNVHFFAWPAISVKKDLSILLSITSCTETWKLFRAARSENLLHVAISEQDCARLPQSSAVTIPIIETGQETPQMLLDLRTLGVYTWKNMVILYDDSISEDLLTRVIRSITRQVTSVGASGISLISLVGKSSDPSELEANLKSGLSGIRSRKLSRNFVVVVHLELVEKIMEYAKRENLVNTDTKWLYVISDSNNKKVQNLNRFKPLLREGDNIAFIYNTTVLTDICQIGIICHINESLGAIFDSLHKAILEEYEIAEPLSEEEWEAIRPNKIQRRNFLLAKVQSYLTKYGKCDNCTQWKLEAGETWGKEYLNREELSGVDLISVGTWRPSDGPRMTDALFPHIAHGFRRSKLPLVSFHNPPWQILITNASGDVVEFKGVVFDVIKELSRNLNFTYNVEVIPTQRYFFNTSVTLFENKTDNEEHLSVTAKSHVSTYRVPQVVLDLVHNKSAAMGACAFTVTEESKKIINFTNAISIQPYTFLVARPRELSRALLFISPFGGDTWFCLSMTIISMGPILYYIHKYSPTYEYKGIRKKGGLATIQNCIWYMYGALLQQGGMHLPYADSARIIVGSWWLVVLVIGTTYCGNLVAYLTFPKMEVPVNTLQDLISKRQSISWSYAENSYFEDRIKESSDYIYKTIYQGAQHLKNGQVMLDEIKAGRHVHIDWKMKLQYVVKQQFQRDDLCSYALGTDEFSEEHIALIVAPDTPYLNKINEEIKRLHQVGLIQKWLENYLPKKDKCFKRKNSLEVNNHTVNLDDMQGSFFVLIIGNKFFIISH
ncbi:ionotropic receptor 93a-like [Euwallacea similis]|uniref:ionotropic receptor 93a-like n=1 Tax=Euwallacea similis TaxID=1736056 RepID=UPI003450DC82